MPSNYLILCCSLLVLPSIFPSIRVFSNESVLCIRWQKYWSFSFSISPSNEYSGLISFTVDCLDLLAVQGIFKSLLQHHSSKASVFRCSIFFIVQLSHPYMTTGKAIALTRQTFVGKAMSLLFNMLSRLVIAFLPRSKPYTIGKQMNVVVVQSNLLQMQATESDLAHWPYMQTKECIFVFLAIYFLLKAQIFVCFKFQSISFQYEKEPNVTLQR